MVPLMTELDLEIPKFKLTRHVKLKVQDDKLFVEGMDDQRERMDLFWGVQVHHGLQGDDSGGGVSPITFSPAVRDQDIRPIKIKINRSGPKGGGGRPGQGSVGIVDSFPWDNRGSRGRCEVVMGTMAWQVPRAMCDVSLE